MVEDVKIIENFIKRKLRPILNRIHYYNPGDINRGLYNVSYLLDKIRSSNVYIDNFSIISWFKSMLVLASRNEKFRFYLKNEFIELNKNFINILNHLIENKYPNQYLKENQFIDFVSKSNKTKLPSAEKRVKNYIEFMPLDLFTSINAYPNYVVYRNVGKANQILDEFYFELAKIIKNSLR